MTRIFAFALLLLILACTSTAERDAAMFNQQLNRMTYDDAISMWGSPTSLTEGDKVFVAVWRRQKQPGALVMPMGTSTMALPMESGSEIYLTFDKVTKRMVAWRM